MILVNDAGDWRHIYWPLEHAEWNGWTPTDLVFPFFLFMVGVAMSLSFASRRAKGATPSSLFQHTLTRSLGILAVGLSLNFIEFLVDRQHMRIPGVLQRIALCYCFGSLITLWTSVRGRVMALAALLAGYWILMRFVPVPGFGIPTHDIPLLQPDQNWVAWLDRKLMMGHLYEGTRDPEGVLSTFPSIATTLLGALTGDWLRSVRDGASRLKGLLGAAAALLIGGQLWNIWFPINKKLWTSSYVLWTAGLALLVLSLCFWRLDMRQFRGAWTKPFLFFGTNALFASVFAEGLSIFLSAVPAHNGNGRTTLQGAIYQGTFAHLPDPYMASVAFAIVYVLFCMIPVWILYRKGIVLKF
ncbi:MAG: lpg1661 family Dot/Icm T4SS effector [Acidobacteriaceae bacterium]